jgi:hypothetical protein
MIAGMSNAAMIWTFAGVLAAASFARGLAMRTNARALDELLWYTTGALILAGAGLLWVSLEGEGVLQQRIVLGVLGALAGTSVLISLGEWIRPTSIAKAEPIQMVQNNLPPPNVTLGPGSIFSYGQTGGIAAGTLNVGPIPRMLNQPRMEALKKQILSELPKDKPITVMAVMGDSEAINFASQIHAFLKDNGFPLSEQNGISQGVFSVSVKGLNVRDDGATRTFVVGANLQ